MHKKIREVAEQAGFALWGTEHWNPGDVVDWSSRYDAELERFAELLIAECSEIVRDVLRDETCSLGYVEATELQTRMKAILDGAWPSQTNKEGLPSK